MNLQNKCEAKEISKGVYACVFGNNFAKMPMHDTLEKAQKAANELNALPRDSRGEK
jgi:hypothetical protein